MNAIHAYDDGPIDGDMPFTAEYSQVPGLSQPAHDRFEAGRRMLDALAGDTSLDADEVDLEDLL